ncbi:helix-turn-helix domain-containing protein [Flavobacterium hydatis]|jgi:transcriptional regulator with XRE-family HTH domain|uniref:Transcriptional regulator n=1 Tax=Flavobacterium hydatis TaxID=991 RepID=A0ABX4CDK6_FLAHY|nr:helix-turn-helix transcriptional regulator [Flavobacterium hydatis]OXA91562.1 transcriptional regulator [Flavobacterium hydatis]
MEIKLRQIREGKGFSQEQMAEYLNISQPQYYRKERGTSQIKESEWEIIAKVLDVEKDELKNENSLFNNKPDEALKNQFVQVLHFSEQLIFELKEHVSTLKEKIIFVRENYESRLKDKEDLILFLKQNKNKSS